MAYMICSHSSSTRQVETQSSARRVFSISDALGTRRSSVELCGVIKYEERVERRSSLLGAGRLG